MTTLTTAVTTVHMMGYTSTRDYLCVYVVTTPWDIMRCSRDYVYA